MTQPPTTRREFLTGAGAGGLGMIALAELLTRDGLLGPRQALAAETPTATIDLAVQQPLAPRPPHFSPRARNCIFIFLDGGPSQMDLFDPKPKLRELHGQPLPESMLENVRFAFINKHAPLKASPRSFRRYGECGMEFSDLLPHLATCADDLCMVRTIVTEQFNHHPAQLMMQCGQGKLGLPAMGSWITYGLGSESQNLPGYVVLAGGRGTSGAATLWQSGFLSSSHAGVLFRTRGEPVLNLSNPPGLPRALRRRGLDALADLNQAHFERMRDPEIHSRIASYELAFRMQAAATQLGDLSGESPHTLDAYGVDREDWKIKVKRDGGPGQYRDFATNCLLARRLVERGVRFVNIFHGFWDHHENVDGELPFYTGMVDQPIAALIQDLKQRGLFDETLLVIGSEFGRTPLGQGAAGRDHHPYAFTMLLAGGGIRGGHTHGETDEIGWAPVRDPVHVNDLHATLLHLFGLDHVRLTYRFRGLDQRLTTVTRESRVVPELLS
ncbi:MAG TPA: DUF1501 domain-containing protein [Planctomycetaceae bacterium]|nr:DUF1501 domain-containing protein [Planctomycetaceae bacterium]